MTKPLIYLVDDDDLVAKLVSMELARAGFEVERFDKGLPAAAAVAKQRPAVLLLDLMLPDTDGLEVLKVVREVAPDLPVVMMSGQGSIKVAVEALKLGAYDFLEKPVDRTCLLAVLKNVLERGELRQQVKALRGELAERYRMKGDSRALADVRDLISRLAPTRANVLITGESGVGKELVARAIHLQSDRAGGPFVALNCAAIPRELIESELFGHERGSFTGAEASRKGKLESADGGTLFLDEIGDMQMAAQAKLLRFLENGELQRVGRNETVSVDARVLAATNKDLAAGIRAGAFREDLFHRLNVVAIRVPPLRERPEDIAVLARDFLDEFCSRHNRLVRFGPGCVERLARHDWPGNVRELRNVIERAVVLSLTDPVEPDEMESFMRTSATTVAIDGTLQSVTDRAEREAVQNAMAAAKGNITAAAQILGVERPSLYRILKRLHIPTE